MRAGVTMRDPSTVYVDWGVSSPPDVVLDPGVILKGATSIGEGSRHRAGHARSSTRRSARDCSVRRSVVERSTVEDGASIGPYSHLRPGSHVGAGAEVGNFAEVKNSRLGARVKQHH